MTVLIKTAWENSNNNTKKKAKLQNKKGKMKDKRNNRI